MYIKCRQCPRGVKIRVIAYQRDRAKARVREETQET